jgi:hypothetical protein
VQRVELRDFCLQLCGSSPIAARASRSTLYGPVLVLFESLAYFLTQEFGLDCRADVALRAPVLSKLSNFI